jgi:nicotinamide phosphoribosyltransferase
MTVENTSPEAYWLTNALESVLMHVWYPTTVATLSRRVKLMLKEKLLAAGSPLDGLDFMLHDFGYRGVSSHESAAIGGAAHLVNFKGTDTLPALTFAQREYGADLASLGFSVPATEHSVMTSLGRDGEQDIVNYLLRDHPSGILSVVADSYDIYTFVDDICIRSQEILTREGVFVIRPDSVTNEHPTPQLLVTWILERLWATFGGMTTPRGFRVLDPHVRVLWGDGIDPHGIEKIVNRAMLAGFSPENLVFGMGGGLLQKVNRDTERFAFKASAMADENGWRSVRKEPLDLSKASKGGRLMLVKTMLNDYATIRDNINEVDQLRTVFEDGKLLNPQQFDGIRERASV